MAAKPETTFSNAIRRALPEGIYSMKNNNQYVAGVADLWFSGQKGDLWVEMKFISKMPVRVPLRPMDELSQLQATWLRDRHKEGRNVAVMIGTKVGRDYGGIVLRDLEWEREIPSGHITSLIRSKQDLVSWIASQVK